MRSKFFSQNLSERQLEILKLLFENDYLQNELQDILSMTAPNLHYHLSRLEENNLIQKKTLYKIGNARINKILLAPTARQSIRDILGYKIENFTLITGFGILKDGYKLPDRVYENLRELHYPISRIVCFTSPDAIKKRREHQKEENLLKIDKLIKFNYEDYRYIESEFFKTVEDILSNEMKTANIIIDLTPLSKLFSFQLLEIANKYQLPCIYLGIDKNGNNKLFSMSNMKIEGRIDQFN